MISRLLTIILIILAGIGTFMFIFSDEILKKKDELIEQAKKEINTRIDDTAKTVQDPATLKNLFKEAEESVRQNIEQ